MDPNTDVRKRPTQERSRKRVQKILDVAAERISKVGADQLKMSDIAKLAEVPIGSVYQYFPNKSSIIRSLAEEHLEQLRKITIDSFTDLTLRENASPLEQLSDMTNRIIDSYYAFYKEEPSYAALWGGLQADAMLNDLEIKDTKESGDLLFEVLKLAFPKHDREYIKYTSLHLSQQVGNTLRFALQLPEDEGQKLVNVFKEHIGRLVSSLFAEY